MRIFAHAVMVALLAVAPASTGGTALNQITFVEWVDRTEHAFRVEVPKGWQVNGGLHWNGQVDYRCFVGARSSDGKVQIFLDDPDILPRTIPNPVYTRMGWVEGRVVQSQTGPIFIQRFLSGSQYARQHATWRLCGNPKWVKVGDLPSLSKSITTALEPLARSSGGMARASAGEASFTCNDAQGYVFATTVLTSSMSGPIQVWGVYKLWGFLSSDPMRSMVARYIMEHMAATFTIDRSWDQACQRKIKDVTGRVIAMQNALAAQVQHNAAQNASNTLAHLNHPNQGVNVRPGGRKSSSVNTILGTKDVCDAIGRCKNVSNDYDTYFMDHSGNVRPGRPGGGPPDNSGVWSPTYTQ